MSIRVISYSELSTFDRCPWRWGILYAHGYRPKEPEVELRFGALIHVMLDEFYTYGKINLKRVRAAVAKRGDAIPEPELWDQAVALLEHYASQFNLERSGATDFGAVTAVEWPFVCPILDEFGRETGFYYAAKVDLITRDYDSPSFWIWDHKTMTAFPESVALALDVQITTEAALLEQMGLPIKGIVLNMLRKVENIEKAKAPVLRRDHMLKQTEELSSWKHNLWLATQRIPADKQNLPLQTLPRIARRDCAWDCPVKDLCIFGLEQQHDAFEYHIAEHFFKSSFDRTDLEAYTKPKKKEHQAYHTTIPEDWVERSRPKRKGAK